MEPLNVVSQLLIRLFRVDRRMIHLFQRIQCLQVCFIVRCDLCPGRTDGNIQLFIPSDAFLCGIGRNQPFVGNLCCQSKLVQQTGAGIVGTD